MKCTLERVTNGAALRTPSITGECEYLPEPGQYFTMTAPPLESGDLRVVTTSEVQEVEKTARGVMVFKTENSTYQLTVTEET